MNVKYVKDSDVDADLDQRLRELLSICFIKPGDEVFRARRYFKECPAHRWLICDDKNRLIAHVALHEKMVVSSGQEIPIGGIAEVCVHPEFRGQGLVRRLLSECHNWLRAHGYVFALLFGEPKVYTSSGYVLISNLLQEIKAEDGTIKWEPVAAMVCELGETGWPQHNVHLPGQTF